ncbi:MAG: SU10 major capsid protein, partial [Candidatus Thorarchaeota archaeon]
MATTASIWAMTEAQTLYDREFSRAIITDPPHGIVSGTEMRDVSNQLDLLALDETPFINRIGWGPESGGVSIEWISEDLGPGYFKTAAVVESAQASIVVGSTNGLDASDAIAQVRQGSVLYYYGSETGDHSLMVVTSTAYGAGGVSIFVSTISAGHGNALFSTYVSILAQANVYVMGSFVNEGSTPGEPTPRQRKVLSNGFTILRKDVGITGSMKATDMYVIGREDRHQIAMRLRELARERERAALYSAQLVKTTALAGLMNGALGFLGLTSGTNIDSTTTALTESSVNTVVSFLWENGGRNLTFFGHIDQVAKFTRWDKNRIRLRVNEGKGGGHITSYLTESG